MSEMVERVARALYTAHFDVSADHDWEGWIPEARAAISAMREPTHMAWPESLSQYWRAAIDNALK